MSNYYAATANHYQSFKRLEGENSCDVCVIGAGFTGLGTALELAIAGFDVLVLEAEKVGFGASGRSGGQIASGYSPGMIETKNTVGTDVARRLWEFSELSKEILYGRISKYGIDCDLGDGELYAAPKKSHENWLRQEKEHCEDHYGYAGYEWIETDRLRGMLGGERYISALYDREGGHLHPLNYTLGLAAAATSEGAHIHENSKAVSVRREGGYVMVETEAGTVKANALVLAGNAYLKAFNLGQRNRFIPVSSGILATEPLGDSRAQEVMATTACVADTYFDLDYFKMSADNRLVYGGQDLSFGPGSLQKNGIRQNMLKTFPMLADVRIDYKWEGLIAANWCKLPDVGRIGRNIYYAQGYSGQGVTLSAAISRILAEAIGGEMGKFDIFGRIPHKNIPPVPFLHRPMIYSLLLWNRIKDLL